MLQETVWLISLILMTSITGVFIYVAANASKTTEQYSEIQARAYGIRGKLFWFLVVVVIIILIATTQTLPYATTRGAIPADAVAIEVNGKQWYWQMSKTTANAGETIVFNVTSGDVNHGLGIYDSDLRLLGQTQAMPGYENKLKFTFEKPGEYQLMCMEYCGLAHHAMVAPFTVKPNNQE